jgi:NADH dehydrogenase
MESVREKALELKSVGDADRLRCHIVNRFEAAIRETDAQRRHRLLTFAVVGGGCTGVETVTELHEFLAQLREEQYERIDPNEVRTVLVEAQDRVLPQMGRRLSRASVRRIQKMGIEVMFNTPVKGLSEEGLQFANGQSALPADTVVWVAGVRAHPVVDDLPVEKDRLRRIVVDEGLRIKDYPNIYVLGDAAHARHPATMEIYPPTAQVAYRQAKVAAANIVADITGGPRQIFDFTYIGDLVSLGRLSGVADPFGIRLRGFSAWLMWRFYYLLSLVGWQNRLRVAVNWLLALLFPANSSLPAQCPPDCAGELCL